MAVGQRRPFELCPPSGSHENSQEPPHKHVYASEGEVHVQNTLFARNNATGGTGDAVRLYNSSEFYGHNSTFAYNDASGVSTGNAIGVFASDVVLNCSVIWGHTTSIDITGEDVTYSDIQGG